MNSLPSPAEDPSPEELEHARQMHGFIQTMLRACRGEWHIMWSDHDEHDVTMSIEDESVVLSKPALERLFRPYDYIEETDIIEEEEIQLLG